MQVDLTIKNYRCFPDDLPARISLRSGLTAFVGANNSGKSSLLRLFYEARGLFQRIADLNVLTVLSRGGTDNFQFSRSVKDMSEVFCDANTRGLDLEFVFRPSQNAPVRSLTDAIVTIRRNENTYSMSFAGPEGGLGSNPANNSEGPDVLTFPHNNNYRLGVANLIETARVLMRSLYVGPFRNAINVGTNEEYFDIQVGQSFVRSWRNYKSGDVRRENVAAYKLTSDIAKIFGFDDLEINASPGEETLQVFINGRSYRLNEVGSGVAQFIIVLANAAIKRPSIIFIDEPELNLHPSLQLDFLTTLASYSTDGVIFSTHNIGLARSAADSVYAVRRIEQGRCEVYHLESIPRLSDFVGELSFSGYKELGFDKILLVEGATDVKTIQQFLRMMKKDHQVVLLPLGGAGLINGVSELELQEVKRISEHVFALIDSERSAPGQALIEGREAFKGVCTAAHIDCHVLDRRATENYFSDRAVKAVVGPNYSALGQYDRLQDARLGWSKTQNWRIAREMTLNEIEGTDLRTFLERL